MRSGSAGIGRQARLRIERSCGFKSHLPHNRGGKLLEIKVFRFSFYINNIVMQEKVHLSFYEKYIDS